MVQTLTRNELRENVVLRVDGGMRSGRDVLVAAALGGDEYGFGTVAMIATGEGPLQLATSVLSACARLYGLSVKHWRRWHAPSIVLGGDDSTVSKVFAVLLCGVWVMCLMCLALYRLYHGSGLPHQ